MRLGRKLVLTTLAAFAFALVPAASALASKAEISGTTLLVDGEATENNQFVISQVEFPIASGTFYFVVDDSITVTPGAGCTDGTTAGTTIDKAACPKAGLTLIDAGGNNGNDEVTIANSVTGVTGKITGNDGTDKLQGGDNINEVLTGGTGPDEFNGGTGGIDRADYTGHNSDVTITMDNAANDGSSSDMNGDNVKDSLEEVLSGNGNDTLVGNANENFLDGGGGSDLLIGGKDGDNLGGGSGRDTANYSDHTQGVYVVIDQVFNDGNPTDDGPGSSLDKVRTDIEKVSGTPFNDTLFGEINDDTANELHGGLGNDYLSGLSGNDDLFGEQDNDTVFGGTGDDELTGSTGDDLLYGNSGKDTVTGNSGRDTMSGGSASDYIKAKDGIRDISIKCGKGRHDKARVDKRHPKDPKAKGCEKKTG
jgi:Ca2+-binding RTX toxin-like protein